MHTWHAYVNFDTYTWHVHTTRIRDMHTLINDTHMRHPYVTRIRYITTHIRDTYTRHVYAVYLFVTYTWHFFVTETWQKCHVYAPHFDEIWWRWHLYATSLRYFWTYIRDTHPTISARHVYTTHIRLFWSCIRDTYTWHVYVNPWHSYVVCEPEPDWPVWHTYVMTYIRDTHTWHIYVTHIRLEPDTYTLTVECDTYTLRTWHAYT